MAYKAPYQNFSTSWTKTVNWAKSQGIGMQAIYPVYQMDSKRLLSGGYVMSEAERTRAILAAQNPNNVTPLPSDTPTTGSGLFGTIGHFFTNVEHDATNIFTGLNPIHLLPNIFDSIKNTVIHPNWIFDPTKNTLANLIPGDQLIAEFEEGGWNNVLSHPLITFLNVLPVADTGVGLIAKAGMAGGMAERLGVSESLIGRSRLLGQDAQNGMGALQLVRKAVGNIPTNKVGPYKDVEGNTVVGKLTVHQRLKGYANTKMSGADQAELAGTMQTVTTAASHELASVSKAWDQSYEAMSDSEKRLAYDIWTGLDTVLGGQDDNKLLTDPRIPEKMRTFFSHTFKMVDFVQERLMAAGKGAEVLMPDGTVEWRAPDGEDLIVTRARDRAQKALEVSEKASAHSDRLAHEIQTNDTIAGPAFETLDKMKQQVAQSIKGTLGEQGTRPELAEKLRPTLPNAQRWDRLNINRDSVAKLIGLTDGSKVTLTQARLINEIYGPGGLIEKVQAAYEAKDFKAMVTLARTLNKRFKNKSISPDLMTDPLNIGVQGVRTTVSPVFDTTRTLAENLYKYATSRAKAEKNLSNALHKNGTLAKIEAYTREQKRFEQAQRDHPAANWQPLQNRLLYKYLAESEEGQVAIAKALKGYESDAKVERETIEKFRTDPARLVEIMQTLNKAASTSVFAGMLSRETIERAEASAKDEIASLRARGFKPRWAPNFAAGDRLPESYDVKIPRLQYLSPDAAHAKSVDLTNTVFDLHAGMSKALFQEVQRDATSTLIDEHFIPGFGHLQSDLIPILQKMYPTLGGIKDHASQEAFVAQILTQEWGLTKFDPNARFGLSSKHIEGDDTIWVPKVMLDGLEKSIEKSQFDVSGAFAGATRVFRNAVLGYSPRFLAHIGLGGSFMLLARQPEALKFIPEGLRMMKDPDFRAKIHTTSTQIGYDKPESAGARAFAQAYGKTAVYHWGQHLMEQLDLDPTKWSSWLKVIPQITFKISNTMTDMQRTLSYLDGAAKARGRSWYVDPETGEKVQMTAERAQEEGMRAANRTMGFLAEMSPFERATLTTIMPFYGWTKHVLTYVVQYPVDHSYRAMFLANLANMQSDEVAKGYYTRIQNLFFLGSPDAQGNVSALDVRALNPLRDVANYATLGGVISALNPVISAPFAMVDPQIIFGSNTLYPTLTYNQLYGTKEASASGGLLTAIEQFVPEATTVDAALGLSQQYRNLQRSNPAAFTKTIFGALNIPFAQVQHLNLKQIAAQQEIDRYQQASAAATQAFQTGDFGALSGYGAVPNPLQPIYNIEPAQLQSIYNSTLAEAGGLPPSEVLPSLPAPAGL